MNHAAHSPMTAVLADVASGRRSSAELLPLVYEELRRVAAARIAQLPPGQTLQPTALVHEAYLRIAEDPNATWDSRAHFFGAASRSMRNILVDIARRKAAIRHGGDRHRQELDTNLGAIEPPDENVLAVDEALNILEERDAAKAELVLLRYFGGFSTEQTADILGVSSRSVERRWRFVRAWLRDFIDGHSDRPAPENQTDG